MLADHHAPQMAIDRMLRDELTDALKVAMKAKDPRRVSTLRLILAAVKDRDIAVRGDGNTDGIPDAEILQLLTKMVRQRRDSIKLYEEGGRVDLAEREAEEITVIEVLKQTSPTRWPSAPTPRPQNTVPSASTSAAVAEGSGGEALSGMGSEPLAGPRGHVPRRPIARVDLAIHAEDKQIRPRRQPLLKRKKHYISITYK